MMMILVGYKEQSKIFEVIGYTMVSPFGSEKEREMAVRDCLDVLMKDPRNECL